MRKTSYVVTFCAVILTVLMNILSARSQTWLVTQSPEIFHTKTVVRYGLMERCERTITDISDGEGGGIKKYGPYKCRPFPARVADECETEFHTFCASWTTAGYVVELGIGFGATALLAIVFGVSTHSRRRRIWKAVAWLVAFHALCQIIAFGIITELYSTAAFPTFERARPGLGYVLNTISWVSAIAVVFGVVTTGLSADAGHRWAAGNRAYRPIEG